SCWNRSCVAWSRRGSTCTATAGSPPTTAASPSARPWSPAPCCAGPDGQAQPLFRSQVERARLRAIFTPVRRGWGYSPLGPLPVGCKEAGRRDDGGGGRIRRGNQVAAGQVEHPVATGVGGETRVIPVGEAGRDLVHRLPGEVHLRHDGCAWGLRTGAAGDVREQVAIGFEHGLPVVV